jgi:hypothetical protein
MQDGASGPGRRQRAFAVKSTSLVVRVVPRVTILVNFLHHLTPLLVAKHLTC